MESSINNENYFFSSKDYEEIRTMHYLSDNIETMIGFETDEIVEDLFDSF